MPKKCQYETCGNNQFGGGFCKWHQSHRSDKIIKPIPRLSRARKKIAPKYSALSKQFVSDNPYCKIKSPECTGRTEGPHHPEGRLGNKLTDLESCIPACNACNLYVEVHDSWARERGFKKSRLTKVAK